jgi:hypothetical protein
VCLQLISAVAMDVITKKIRKRKFTFKNLFI